MLHIMKVYLLFSTLPKENKLKKPSQNSKLFAKKKFTTELKIICKLSHPYWIYRLNSSKIESIFKIQKF
jgi:hypothetical protein